MLLLCAAATVDVGWSDAGGRGALMPEMSGAENRGGVSSDRFRRGGVNPATESLGEGNAVSWRSGELSGVDDEDRSIRDAVVGAARWLCLSE